MSEIMSLAPLLHSRISYFYDVYILREKKRELGRTWREEKKLYIRCVKGCRSVGGWAPAPPISYRIGPSGPNDEKHHPSTGLMEGILSSFRRSSGDNNLKGGVHIKPRVPPPVDKDRMLKYDGRHLSFFFPSCFVQVEMFTCIIYSKERGGTLCENNAKKRRTTLWWSPWQHSIQKSIVLCIHIIHNLYDAFMMGL